MLHIRDISLRHRLLIANFTMVFVPIFILTVLGFLLVSGLRFSSPHNDLTTLWPEKGPALSIQYTVSSLRVKAERPGPLRLKDLREDCQVLESLGIATAIIRHDQVAYVTPGVDFYGLANRVLEKAHGQQTIMTWDATVSSSAIRRRTAGRRSSPPETRLSSPRAASVKAWPKTSSKACSSSLSARPASSSSPAASSCRASYRAKS